ncbi:MAG: AAA family ATPase [Desulfovibrionaceae bacterium]|nr:AAA family ATPase [Desulfovibrionaceae bacterium]
MPDQTTEKFYESQVRECELAKERIENSLREAAKKSEKQVHAIDAVDFINMNLPPKDPILEGLVYTQDLIEIFAARGVGKTLFSMQVGIHIAAGRDFLKWKNTGAKKVLYIDGEMPGGLLQSRIKQALEYGHINEDDIRGRFKILTPDLHGTQLNLAQNANQLLIDSDVEWADVIMLDSFLTLFSYGKINDYESCIPLNDYLKSLRTRNKIVIFIHHAGKGGAQLGSVGKEIILDTVIQLKPRESESTELVLSFTKGRSLKESEKRPVLLTLNDCGWSLKNYAIEDQILELVESTDMKQVAIAQELDVSQSTVSRTLKRLGITRR